MPTLPLVERATILSKTYAMITQHFAHWQAIPFYDLDAAFRETLEVGLSTEDRREFGLVMFKFIAGLKNGHSWYVDREIYDTTKQVGFYLLPHDAESWYVSRSVIADLSAGELVTHLNGQPVPAFYEAMRQYLPASSERERQVRFTSHLYFGWFLPQVFTLRLADGRELTIDRGQIPRPDLSTQGRWLRPGKVAYIHIQTFNEPHGEERALEYVAEFQDSPAIIFDVRRNTGGVSPSMLVDALMDRPYQYASEATPATFSLFQFQQGFFKKLPEASDALRAGADFLSPFAHPSLQWPAPVITPRTTLYRGKVLILTSRYTGSAAEDFVMPFKNNGRGTLIGETTAGSSGQPYHHNFGDGIRIYIGTKRTYFPDGSAFEGVGIAPDVPIQLELNDLRAGRDPVLDYALDLAERG